MDEQPTWKEALALERIEDAKSANDGAVRKLVRELFPSHDFGDWPESFTASREQMVGDQGR